jgi:hypothetical protein
MRRNRLDWMLLLTAIAAGALAACGSSSGTPRDGSADRTHHDASRADTSPEAAALGTPYACVGGVILTSLDGGEIVAPADAGPPVTCVVGQSYCQAESGDKTVGQLPTHTCTGLSLDGGLGVCTDTPTCACICAQPNIICYTECSCDDTGGKVIISCHQI